MIFTLITMQIYAKTPLSGMVAINLLQTVCGNYIVVRISEYIIKKPVNIVSV